MPMDSTIAVYLSMVALALSGFNTWFLFRKGAITKDDVIMMLRIMMALIPFTNNPMFKAIFNDVIHAFMERFKMQKSIEDVEFLMKRVLERVAEMQQQGPETPQQATTKAPEKAPDKKG